MSQRGSQALAESAALIRARSSIGPLGVTPVTYSVQSR
jgi:hypothetical protein